MSDNNTLKETQENLYSKNKEFTKNTHLISKIGLKDNIYQAYKTLKESRAMYIPDINGETINNLLENTDIYKIVNSKLNYYQPNKVKITKFIKYNGEKTYLSIPTIKDSLLQQSIKQILEPILEAKFYCNSYGSRPYRTVNNAIAKTYFFMQKHNLEYCLKIDLNDVLFQADQNVLIKQLWGLGVQDRKLISILKAQLKAPIDSETCKNNEGKGIIQSGLLAPLLQNVYLNDLDWWVANQWENIKTKKNYTRIRERNGKTWVENSNKFRALKTTDLKEIYLVRFNSQILIFCRKYTDLQKLEYAIKEWLKIRLKLANINIEKKNLKKEFVTFLGFKIKLRKKGSKYVVESHVTKESLKIIKTTLKSIIKDLQHSNSEKTFFEKVNQYNANIIGIHSFFNIATDISLDFQRMSMEIQKIIYNRLRKTYEISKETPAEYKNKNNVIYNKYKESAQIRYLNNIPIYPIGYVKNKAPSSKVQDETPYTVIGRSLIEKRLCKDYDINILKRLLLKPQYGTKELNENICILYCRQKGRCKVTGKYLAYDEINCHHIIPKSLGGDDNIKNLVIIHKDIHKLIHSTVDATIITLGAIIETQEQVNKINKYRKKCKLPDIEMLL